MSLNHVLPDALTRIAVAQHGVISRETLLAEISARSVANVVARGLLRQLAPGVYHVAGMPMTWHAEMAAAVLYVDRQARRKLRPDSPRPVVALSGLSAARVMGLVAGAKRPFLVSNPLSRSRRHRVRHREALTAADVERVDGICCTTVEWTAAELLARGGHVADNVLADAVRRGMTTVAAVLTTGERAGLLSPNEWTEQVLSRLVLPARSGAERLLAGALRGRGVPDVRVNEVFTLNGRAWELDLAMPDARLCVEVDGQHHLRAEQRARDVWKTRDLRADGWQLLRFSAQRVHDDLEGVVEAVVQVHAGRLTRSSA